MLLYSFLKLPVRLALWIFCRKIETVTSKAFQHPGPLLIVANHPNSFLDAIIISVQFNTPIYSLVPGHVFCKPWHKRLLKILNMIPLYRLNEGTENLLHNTAAFEHCKKILEQGGIILIFAEGISINNHELRPFAKSAARIAIRNSHIENLHILPLGISYHSFTRMGKFVRIDPATPITVSSLLIFEEDGKNIHHINEQVFACVSKRIKPVTMPIENKCLQYLLFFAGLVGYILHLPLYLVIKKYVLMKTRNTIYYDSVLFVVLFCTYPLYLILLALVLLLLHCSWYAITIILICHPLLARVAVHIFSTRHSN